MNLAEGIAGCVIQVIETWQ